MSVGYHIFKYIYRDKPSYKDVYRDKHEYKGKLKVTYSFNLLQSGSVDTPDESTNDSDNDSLHLCSQQNQRR